MRLAVSNIAWESGDDEQVADVLLGAGLTEVEIAPTKVFGDISAVPAEAARAYRDVWADRGLRIVALQSLLFGRPDLEVFGATRDQTLEFLQRTTELAASLGARVLVFGSPKNRLVPEGMETERAMDEAAEFFRKVGEAAAANGVVFCIEPNPEAYACNFVTESSAGRELVRRVDSPGFGLHLDAAAMTLQGEEPGEAIRASSAELRHFHVSAPQLGPIETEAVDHASAAAALRDIRYEGTVSIEMRPSADPVRAVADALAITTSFYG